jgi:hypothetical protein
MSGLRVFVIGLFAGLFAGCGDSSEGPAPLFASCSATADCEEGLLCAPGGHLANRCVFQCDSDSECEGLLGAGHDCVNGLCTGVCNAANCVGGDDRGPYASCASGLSCRPRGGISCLYDCAVP